ncbi:hypothetical protein DFH28DRAFT_901746 [Melampsora americana]|nr:hypothetical protein DFH28DRAFT_901746 [Melampsora americana]
MNPSTEDIINQVNLICHDAISSGHQEELTPRTIINELVKRLSVDEPYLKQKEIKLLIKSTATTALEQMSSPDDQSEIEEDLISFHPSDLEPQIPFQSSSQTKSKPNQKDKVEDASCEGQVFERSKSKIELNLSESGESLKSQSVKPKPPRSRVSRAEKKDGVKSAEFIDSDGEPITESPPNLAPSSKSKRKSTGEDPELAPPSKQSKRKSKATKPTKASSTDDKYAKEIKRLKGYVIACGVRKRWAQEFATCHTPTSQIQRIKLILSDLGMPNRYSMNKAEEIRQRRELEDDLNSLQPVDQDDDEEDRKKTKKGKMVIDSDDEDQDEDEGEGERKVKKNPFAFLGQNEGDESD